MLETGNRLKLLLSRSSAWKLLRGTRMQAYRLSSKQGNGIPQVPHSIPGTFLKSKHGMKVQSWDLWELRPTCIGNAGPSKPIAWQKVASFDPVLLLHMRGNILRDISATAFKYTNISLLFTFSTTVLSTSFSSLNVLWKEWHVRL